LAIATEALAVISNCVVLSGRGGQHTILVADILTTGSGCTSGLAPRCLSSPLRSIFHTLEMAQCGGCKFHNIEPAETVHLPSIENVNPPQIRGPDVVSTELAPHFSNLLDILTRQADQTVAFHFAAL
jgi:hypothetical protein